MPGDKWCKLFKYRHSQLTQRLAENIKPARAKVSPGVVQGFYDKLANTLKLDNTK